MFGPDIPHHPNYREALIEVAVVTNAALAAHTLQREIGGEAKDGVRTAYGVYLMTERTVWAPRCGSNGVIGLAAPPASARASSNSATRCSAPTESPRCFCREPPPLPDREEKHIQEGGK